MNLHERVPAALEGERVDRVVALATGLSRREVDQLISSGAVTADGRVVTRRQARVREGQVLEVELPDRPSVERLAPDPGVEVTVVYEDPDLIVVDKAAGVVVHPGSGRDTHTLVQGLLARYPELADVGDPTRPGVVHRLDRLTSGLLLVARSPASYDVLVERLRRREVTRRYDVLVWGVPGADEGLIDAPVGRSERHRTRMAVRSDGRPARTRYRVVQRFAEPETARLEATLETGRTHQIRVHLSSIGHPVVGDSTYGGDRRPLPLDRLWLHAAHLELEHPVTDQPLAFDAPLPAELRDVLDTLTPAP